VLQNIAALRRPLFPKKQIIERIFSENRGKRINSIKKRLAHLRISGRMKIRIS